MPGANTTSLWIEAEALDWAVRRQSGLTFSDQARLKKWLADDPAHEEALNRVAAMAEESRRARKEGTAPTIITALHALALERKKKRRVGMLCATALVLLIALFWLSGARLIGKPDTVAGPMKHANGR